MVCLSFSSYLAIIIISYIICRSLANYENWQKRTCLLDYLVSVSYYEDYLFPPNILGLSDQLEV